ncbi:MAG TPA: hypothetical protein VGR89_08610 [Puia sp.]|nr:hypothetical protein [Puia sp.]
MTIVDTLSGGTIDSIGKSQAIPYDSVPSAITCPPATGGSCSPSYQYQWQESVDRVSWQDITGATSQNLAPAQSLQQGTFFRRKVTDSTSGTIAYSDIASVDVGPPSPGTSSGPRMPLPGQDMASIRPIANLKLF